MKLALLVLALVLLGWLWWRARRRIDVDADGVSAVRTGDADMARAIARARETFPAFVARLRDPQPGDQDFGIKAAVEHDGAIEHLWLTDVRVDDDGFEGEVANTPGLVPLALGARWRGRLDQLSDWTWLQDGRMQGNFTLRAMLPRMPKAQREQFARLLESRWDTQPVVHRPWPRDAGMPGTPLPDAISHGDSTLMAGVQAHWEARLGAVPQVFHEILSPSAHVDLYPFPAHAARPFHVVATTGMAEQAMQLLPDSGAGTLAEVFVVLPADWPLDAAAWQRDEGGYWPMRWLKRVARHHYETGRWLGPGHLLLHGDPAQPLEQGLPYDSVVLTPPRGPLAGLGDVVLTDGRRVQLLCLTFLRPEERERLERDGWDAFAASLPDDRLSV